VTRLCAARPKICVIFTNIYYNIKRWFVVIFQEVSRDFPSSNRIRGSIQVSIKWVPLDLSSEIKRPGREADHTTLLSFLRWERVELYLHSLTCLRGIHTNDLTKKNLRGSNRSVFQGAVLSFHWVSEETQNKLSCCPDWDPATDILDTLYSTATLSSLSLSAWGNTK